MSNDNDGTGEIEGVHHELATINNHLKLAEQKMNLIAPATRVGALPPGCGVSLAVLWVDTTMHDGKKYGPDCYQVDGGKLALSRHVIDRLGAAIGISWDPVASARTDGHARANVWSYKAVGIYRQFDGTPVTISNEYEWDASETSPRVEEMREAAEGPGVADWKKQKLNGNIRQLRRFGLQRAVTGARLRAMSDVGFKRAYSPEELQKPFAIARVHFDGRTDDPELARAFALATATNMLGSSQLLYGGVAAPMAPPTPAAILPADYQEQAEQTDDDPVYRIPAGKHKGVSIHDCDNVTLQYWGGECADEDLSSAIATELATRKL